MRVSQLLTCAAVCAFLSFPILAQQVSSPPTTSDPQAVALLQESLTALGGGDAITDVTLNGTITQNFESVTQSGTISLVATAAGQSKITSTFPTGTGTEIRDISSGSPLLTVTGADSVPVSVATQSAISPTPCWFFLPLFLNEAVSSGFYTSAYVGQEIYGGSPVLQLSLWPLSTNSSYSAFPASVTRHDLYLDPATLLPVAISFNAHPYESADPNKVLTPYGGNPVDQLEQVTFSDYQSIEGHRVALHIHTLINLPTGQLTTDIQISSVEFNTGATVSAN